MVSDMDYRFKAIKLLRAARAFLSLKELSEVTGIPISMLSRYSSGKILPSNTNAAKIIKGLLEGEVVKRIVRKGFKVHASIYDLSPITSNPHALTLISEYVLSRIGDDYSAIVTPEAGGISFATALSIASGKKLVVARRNKPVSGSYLEIPVTRDPITMDYYYISEEAISEVSRVLLVDDFSVRGKTLGSIANRLEDSGIEVVATYVIAGIGREWKRHLKNPHSIIEV